jgi:hypothetical protein
VDNSNVFIEGQRYAARKNNLNDVFDVSWRIDFGSLLNEVANGHRIIAAILVGSTPPPTDSLWGAASAGGFAVYAHKRSFSSGEEKAVDSELLTQGLKVILRHPHPAILKLLSGDRDFEPLLRTASEEKWETELWGFKSGLSTNLMQIVNRVKPLDDVFDQIGKYQKI